MFTSVGKMKIKTPKYNSPKTMYSEDTLDNMVGGSNVEWVLSKLILNNVPGSSLIWTCQILNFEYRKVAVKVGWLLLDSWHNSTPPIQIIFIQFFVPFGKEKKNIWLGRDSNPRSINLKPMANNN